MDMNIAPSQHGIKKVTTIGTGTMGPGVTLCFALAGYEVTLYGRRQEGVDQCIAAIHASLQTHEKLGLIDTAGIRRVLRNIRNTTDFRAAVSAADFVIESVDEDLEVKQQLFRELSAICKPNAILATNTSSLSITAIAEPIIPSMRPNIVAAHFFYPGHMMPGVEIIRSDYTSDHAANATLALMHNCGKQAILLHRETPGFVVNLVQAALGYAAFDLLEKGYKPTQIDTMIGGAKLFDAIGTDNAKPEEQTDDHLILNTAKAALNNAISRLVDAGVANKAEIGGVLRATLGLRYPVTGPLLTMDMAGLDIFHAILTNCREFLGIETGVPERLVNLTNKGFIGAKTAKEGQIGYGTYSWTTEVGKRLQEDRLAALAAYQKAQRPIVSTAAAMSAATQG